MFYQMTRRSKDYKQSLIQRKLEEKTNKQLYHSFLGVLLQPANLEDASTSDAVHLCHGCLLH